jgi:uncharacterized protein
MGKHIVVDGFNLIRRDRELSGIEQKNFYNAQNVLVERLAQYRRGTTHRVTVVFDGRRGPNAFRSRGLKNGVEIIYSSQGETADDVIRELAARGPRDCTWVATADRDLAHSCRTLGVGVVEPETVLRAVRPKALPPVGHDFWHGKREERGWPGHTRKKGNPRRAPKQQRRQHDLW